MLFTPKDLEEFVLESDRRGGPGNPAAEEYWKDFNYQSAITVSSDLDPDSEAYHSLMMEVYREIANRQFDPVITEFTDVKVDPLVHKESPYSFADASHRALHYLRLATAHQLSYANGGTALDMGCGWGLSSEFLAQLGYRVTAVDINPRFVELVTRRSIRLGLNITAKQSPFEDYFADPETFDLALFYECLHHAPKPGKLLKSVATWLKPGGSLMLSGEPIQATWWPHWGLRLDALSVYCIRKFGWFESGWSIDYITHCLLAAGLTPEYHQSPDPTIGSTLIGRKLVSLAGSQLRNVAVLEDWWEEGKFLISNKSGGISRLRLPSVGKSKIRFTLNNFGVAPFEMLIDVQETAERVSMHPGKNVIEVPLGFTDAGSILLSFDAPSWCPAEVLGNGDVRRLAFHLEQIDFL